MKMLVVSQPPIAGVPAHVLDLLAFLDPAHYELDVACPPGSNLWTALAGRGDVRLHPIDCSRRPAPGDLLSFARLLPLVRRADIVHAHSSKAGFLARFAALVSRRTHRCVFTPHGWSFWAFDGAEGALYRQLERWAARWCRVMVALSEFERDTGLAAGVGRADQFRVIPNGIDTDRFQRPHNPVSGRVIMVARLAPPKMPLLAVDAMGELHARLPDAHLQLVGDGPLWPEVERRIEERGLGEVVSMLGKRDDVPELLSRAACMLLTSGYEGCPLSLIEAMAAGLPIVASQAGGLSEIVDHERTGYLVAPDPTSIAGALERVLTANDGGQSMGSAARREARLRFSRERMARDTLAVYHELESGRGPTCR